MISNSKHHFNFASKTNKKSPLIIEDLSNSALEDLSLEESSNVVGGRFPTLDTTLVKTDVPIQQEPILNKTLVFQPNENDRLRLCAIDPTFC